MKTQIIDRTTGGSAETFEIGMKGYFWDNENSIHLGVLTGILKDQDMPYSRSSGNNWRHFSPTIPEWFLPSEAKAEKKGIEFVKCIDSNGQTSNPFLTEKSFAIIERICRDVEGFDLLKCTKKEPDESVKAHEIWYFGHWNDGVI